MTTQSEVFKLILEAITNRDSFLKWHDLEESIKEALAQQINEQAKTLSVKQFTISQEDFENDRYA